ncbi:MAG: putative toxin-antitoxin system toxin component, PIN family [Gemmatimonadota bacterium]
MFLDANVLFSAAWRPDTGLARLWDLAGAELVTSGYAAEEARRNLAGEEQRARLGDLLREVRIVPEAPDRKLPEGLDVPAKDRPILQAALAAGSTHLLTGDVRHFGPWLGRRVAGVRVLTPRRYLSGRAD